MDQRRCVLSTNPGNNVQMVERVILSRPWWVMRTGSESFNLHYQETTPKFTGNSKTCVYNHMPENIKYHSKWQLYKALEKAFGDRIHEVTKPTYLFEGFDKKRFLQHYVYQQTKTGPRLPYYDAECANVWIMKPLAMNRGRGIAIVRSPAEAETHQQAFSGRKFVIQQYIEHPLLYQGRKFDIRCYGLVTHGGCGYVYDVGYLRLASVSYDAFAGDLAVHLTNNEFQNKTEHYSQFEEGNMASFRALDACTNGQFLASVWPRIKQLMARTMLAVGPIQATSVGCFELIGFDFMLENRAGEITPVLIEANMNPCMKLASPVSWAILPQLIDDVMQLTIDKTFAPPKSVANQLEAANRTAIAAGNVFQEHDEEYYKDPQKRQIEGLRYDVLRTGYAVTRPNLFKQVMASWREVKPANCNQK